MGSQSNDIVNEPWLTADYHSQIDTIGALCTRLNQFEDELADRILKAQEYAHKTSGDANEIATEEWMYFAHVSMYQGAAHSMAAVSMLAPLIESAFKDVCRRINRPIPLPECQTGGLVADIMKVAREEGMVVDYLPNNLRPMLEAIFEYRNKMLHCGFEWPPDEIRKFDARRKSWPCAWFEHSSLGDDVWMFYMSRTFISHCLDTTREVVDGIEDFLVDRVRRALGEPPLGRQHGAIS